MKLKLDPFSQSGFSVVQQTIVTGGGSSTSGTSQDPVTLAGEDYLSLSGQQITANAIDLDNLSATGTPDNTNFLRGDNTWATPSGSGDVVGPSSATDEAVARFNTTTGKLLQNSPVTISDTGNITIAETSLGGSTIEIRTANRTDSNPGDSLSFYAASANTGNANGGSLLFDAGDGVGTGDGGSITFAAGSGSPDGTYQFRKPGTSHDLILDTSSLSADRTLTAPNATTTIVGTDATQTLTAKTINGPDNTITNLAVSNLAGSAVVTEAEGLASSDNDTSLPTTAAVKDYVDTAVAAGVSDGDKGDITVSGSGATWTIDNDVVTYAKMQNVSATSRLLGRITASAGDVEELTAANVRTIINVADGATAYTDELAQDAVGGILDDTSEIALAYNDATPSITASLVAGSIDETKLDASVNASLDLADSAVQDLADLGITSSAAELNFTDGVTSAIQTQLDGKSGTAHTHTLVTGATDVTASAAELNILDGATLTTTELNYVDGVTSAIQTQLDGKQPLDADLTTLSTAFTTASASGAASLALAEDTDNGSNKVTLSAPASIASDKTITLPDATTTLVGTDTTDTLTNKTFDSTSPTAFMFPGFIMPYGGLASPNAAWLMCYGQAVSRATYANLFAAIVPTIGTFTITIASPSVGTLNSHGLLTGDQVYLTTTGALPTGLSANTLYYIIRVDANTFRLATSRANAVAGTAINTSGTQSGTHTLRGCPYGLGDGSTTFNLPDLRGRVLAGFDGMGGTAANRLTLARSQGTYGQVGATGGAETHTLVTAELATHSHTYVAPFGGGSVGAGGAVANAVNGASTGNAGGDTAHNNVQPTITVNYLIKT